MRFDPMTGQPIEDDEDGFVQAGSFGAAAWDASENAQFDQGSAASMQGGFDPMTGEPINGGFDPMTGEPINGGFDPMTGEPINGGFDPMTGEPINGGFDPMTGEPINNGTYYDPATGQPVQPSGFDPMTGEPIYGGFDPMTGEPVQPSGFDPMTGEPIYGGFDPMTGEPISGGGNVVKGKKGGKFPKVIIAAAAVVVVAGAAVFGVAKSGMFMSAETKVLKAAANTVMDTTSIIDVLKGVTILSSDEFTVNTSLSGQGGEMTASLMYSKDKIQANASMDIPDVPAMDFIILMDDESVKGQIPSISDQVLTYYYTREKTGYIAEMAEEELEMIDEILVTLSTAENSEQFTKDLTAAFMEEYEKIEFEKADSDKFEVNGKDVECKGYVTELTEDTFLDLIDSIESVYEDYYDVDMGYVFDEMEYTFEDMPDMEVTVFIYKDQIACIRMEVDREEVEVRFLGGETRMQNIEIAYEGDEIVEIEGETDGSIETMNVTIDGEDVLEIEYDSKSGDFELSASDDYFYVSGILLSESNSISITVDELEVYGSSVGMEGSLEIKKGAKFESLKGEEFDIGEASEDELYDVVMEYEELFY